MKATKFLERHTRSGEAEILERIEKLALRTATGSSRLHLGIGDDAALFRGTKGNDQILTCDWSLEGTHFLRDKHPADTVGWKCLARAVSDIAAMGGIAQCFLLSLALPASHTSTWLDEFFLGLGRAAKRFGCVLAGGDTTRRKDILINVTVVGKVPRGVAVLRSGARPGDILFTSGRLGEADLGLRRVLTSKRIANLTEPLLRKHLYPEPRLALGRWLAEKRLPSAMMDLSDGLSTDLPRLCAASGVGARVIAAKIPMARVPGGSRSDRGKLESALHGGDDYELLFSVPRKKCARIPRHFQGLPITAIGEITTRRTLTLIGRDLSESPLPSRGWDSFRTSR
jgi:thiamine-monophosphate kinase